MKKIFNNYKGIYIPKRPEKWINKDPIRYLSLWERQTFKYLENNPNVKFIGSETIVVKYKDPLEENKFRKYFIDLEIHFVNGEKILVEIKPKSQVKNPLEKKNIPKNLKTKKGMNFLKEVEVFAINNAKWESARNFAKNSNYKNFLIWGEDELTKLGIRIK